MQRSSSPSARGNFNQHPQQQVAPSSMGAPPTVQVTISTPNTPLTSTKEKKKKLSFFNLMKNKKTSSKVIP